MDDWPTHLENEDIRLALDLAQSVADWVEAAFGRGVDLHVSGRETIAVGAFFVVFEHHASVVALTKLHHRASAHALLRPAFEALVRGLWVLAAEQSQLEHFQDGSRTGDPSKLLRVAADKNPRRKDYYDGLRATWEASSETLHTYTHHRFQSLVRWSGEASVHDTEVVDLLRFSASLCVEAAGEFVTLMAKHPVPGREDDTARTVAGLRPHLERFTLGLVALEQRTLDIRT
ncbi:DUF6988 family protein [Pseudomonas sp. Hp2]|uniref:DUF6988 family protein n=1 Tax=Pseudomonas sp. Hp2 TaxID=701189 RepID=UPI0011299C89|nr:hypothetical protein [Pseudomonas sp. Hp2]